jgi:hypothetical protein
MTSLPPPWYLNALAVLGLFSVGFPLGNRIAQSFSRTQTDVRSSPAFNLLRLLFLVVSIAGAYASWHALQQMSRMTHAGNLWLLLALTGVIPGIGVGFLLSSVTEASRVKGLSKQQEEAWLAPQLLTASLTELRNHEWCWLDPCKPLPAVLVLYRLLDRTSLGFFSRSRLRKPAKLFRAPPASNDPMYRFPWECEAIAINPDFAEAYVRRAIDGNYIFQVQGQVAPPQGWNLRGKEVEKRWVTTLTTPS